MADVKGEMGDRRALTEQSRTQRARERRRKLVAGFAALAVVDGALIVFVVMGLNGSRKPYAGPQVVPTTVVSGSAVAQGSIASVPNTTGIRGVLAYDVKGYPAPGTADAGTISHDHVAGRVRYTVSPPVGGPHNSMWMNAGVYTRLIPNELVVHDLEHGAVWITYRPGLSIVDISNLKRFVDRQSLINEGRNANRYIVMSPWADNSLPSPIVISSWGYQLAVGSPNDPRLQRFVNTFRSSQTDSPEPDAPVDGVPVQTGGQPATDGSKFANPSGSAG